MTKNAGFDILMMPGGNPSRNENKKGGRQKRERAGRRATNAGASLRNNQRRAMCEGIHRTGRATAAMR